MTITAYRFWTVVPVLLLFLCRYELRAQYSPAAAGNLYFENYSTAEGLSQLSIYAIAQDASGFMWFGTQDGLNRYDGRKFKIYAQQNDAGKNLPSNAIFSLYFDTAHHLLWIGTSRGLCLYNPSADSLEKFSDIFPFATVLEKLPIQKIVSFKKDEYWVIAYNTGLYCLNTRSGTIRSFFTNRQEKSVVTDIAWHQGKIIVSLLYTLLVLAPEGDTYQPQALHGKYQFPQIAALASYHNSLWVGTISDGCYIVKKEVEKQENITASDIVFGGVFCFGIYNDELWIGSRGSGIYKYNDGTNTVIRAIHDQFVPTSPASNFVVYLFKDRQGNMWCGLSGGLAKYDPFRYQFGHVNGPTSLNGSLLDKTIYCMYTAKDGTRFIGTQNKGLFEWEKTTNAFIHFPETAIVGKTNNVIYSITEDDRGGLWAATCGGLLLLERKTKKINYFPENRKTARLNKMYAIIKLKKADSLLVSADDGLHFFSLRDKQWKSFSHEPENMSLTQGFAAFRSGRHFYEDENNILWLCSGSGLIKYNYLQNKMEPVKVVNNISPSIRHLLADGPYFLLATDNGLLVYDYRKDTLIKHLETKLNSFSNVCYAVQKDGEGFYWLSTNSGLCKVNRQFEIVQKYNTGNGLAFSEYNTACASKDANGTLYFGGMGGLTYFNPSQLRQSNFSPQPVISDITVNNKPWMMNTNPALIQKLNFNHSQNFLSIHFAVTNFSNEGNNVFSYRLKGLDDTWSAAGTSNIASFTSLPPGDYVFELRAANSDGIWSEAVTSLAIAIQPPWWKTLWFRFAIAALLAGAVILFMRRRIDTIRKEANLKQQIAEAEMMAMRMQMNPHFIFNCLNSIREMILNNENDEASHFLGKFAHLIRITLDQTGRPFVSLRSTIEHLLLYVEMEQIRNSYFTSRILADDELNPDEVMLPPMLLQPFVENAIWHGITANRKNINIKIDFKKTDDQLVCIIEDNGIGINQSLKNKTNGNKSHISLGIQNITHRISLLNEKFNQKSAVSIKDKTELFDYTGTGTVVQLFLPIEETM